MARAIEKIIKLDADLVDKLIAFGSANGMTFEESCAILIRAGFASDIEPESWRVLSQAAEVLRKLS